MKIGFDSGQSSLKATLSLIDTTPDICDDKPNTSSFRESSVYKSFIIALAPGLQETYESIKFLFDLLNLKKQSDFKLSGDLKCTNLILGLQNHASKHPCPYCFTYQHGIDQSSIGEFEPRTFELIKANCNAWIQSKRMERDLQHFYNCHHEPLIERSGPIINVVVPSPLHCLIGIVNKIYKELLKVFPQAEAWPSKLHLVPQVQHGGCDFNGNACHHLLKNIDILDSLGTTRRNKKVLDPFISSLSSFGDLVHGTFSHTLDPNYENLIAQFKKAYMATGISVTSKAHIIFHHLGEYLTITGRGLALDSEQSLESSHFLFAQTHSKYYIRDKNSSKFVPKLIHALCDYNGSHI